MPESVPARNGDERMFLMRLQFQQDSSLPAGKGPSGFTFLEVMVAVMIIAIAFVTLIGSQSQSVTVAGDSRFNVNAALLAQQKLAELEAAPFYEVFSGSGDFGEEHPAYRWQAEVSDLSEGETAIPGANDMLKTIDLTVSLGEEGSQSYTVRSIIMRKTEPVKP